MYVGGWLTVNLRLRIDRGQSINSSMPGAYGKPLVSTRAVPRLACGHRHHRFDARRLRRRSVLGYHNYLKTEGVEVPRPQGSIKNSQVGHFTYSAEP